MRRRITLDADGVLLDFLTPAFDIIEKITGKRYKAEDFDTWDIFGSFGKEIEAACYEQYKIEGFCASIKPYPEALEGVAKLKELGEVHVVTSAIHGRHWYFERAEAMHKYFDIPPWDVHFTRHKEYVFSHVFVDDRPAHVVKWADRHPGGLGLLWDQPYNRKEWGQLMQSSRHGNIYRVNSWRDVYSAAESVRVDEIKFPPVQTF